MSVISEVKQSPSTTCLYRANILGFLTFATASITLFGTLLISDSIPKTPFITVIALTSTCGAAGLVTAIGTRVILSARPDFA